MRQTITSMLVIIVLLLTGNVSLASFIRSDEIWSGTVAISEDLLIPQGVTLTIRQGTRIVVSGNDSTKTDPEFVSPHVEIMVRGRLIAEGNETAPVVFRGDGTGKEPWGGIIVEGGGFVSLSNTVVRDAETGLSLFRGTAKVTRSVISDNRVGIIAAGRHASLSLSGSHIHSNDYGLELFDSPDTLLIDTQISGNRKKDRHEFSPSPFAGISPPHRITTPPGRIEQSTVLAGDTVWEGVVDIDHEIRIPEGSRLFIKPGTTVRFFRLDRNGDGIGEAGLLVQGTIVAKGNADAPIRFLSAETVSRAADWDGINIMNSDSSQNLFEWCIFTDAYRPLHFHFSNVFVSHSTFSDNFRGIQFQESTVSILDSLFSGNTSGMQGRDSVIELVGSRFFGNVTGFNILRSTARIADVTVSGSLREGGRIREGSLDLSSSRFTKNLQGIQILDLPHGRAIRSVFAHNGTYGVSARNSGDLLIAENHIGSNGINGLMLQDASGTLRGNLITGNGERGIGVISFFGQMRENVLAANRLTELENEGKHPVDARKNWWGKHDPTASVVDGRTDSKRGVVAIDPPLESPPLFVWRWETIDTDTVLSGEVSFPRPVSVVRGATLTLLPGTVLRLSPGIGMTVHGKFFSLGERSNPVIVAGESSANPKRWDEILLDRAEGCIIRHTVVEGGTWGIHSHFTNLSVESSLFRNNGGGIRFRGGPVTIRTSRFVENGIGIRSYAGEGMIEDCIITGNDIGIFVREGASSLSVVRSDLSGNREFAIRLGDFNASDLIATDNWWGTEDPSESIFDGVDEEGIGVVKWHPPLAAPPQWRTAR